MKRFFIYCTILITFAINSEDLPIISLPKVDINIKDTKDFESNIDIAGRGLPDIKIDPIIRPEFTKEIKVDLEETLPSRIDNPEKTKSVDAQILFGYGLNNYMLADFSIFIKDINPYISINYKRIAKENLWFDDFNRKVPYSQDKFDSSIIFTKGPFSLNAAAGYYGTTYSLQDESIYNYFAKRILNVDLTPSYRFTNNNDLSLVINNSFIFHNLSDMKTKNSSYRNDFDYFFNGYLKYSHVLFTSHFVSIYTGYNFDYFYNVSEGYSDFTHYTSFHNINAGFAYSGTIKNILLLRLNLDFKGLWRNGEFHWYLIPDAEIGFNFADYVTCFIAGGAKQGNKPDKNWFISNEYSILPDTTLPFYKWYGKSGFKSAYAGFAYLSADVEFIYNQNGYDRTLLNKKEKLYTLTERTFFELNLNAAGSLNYRKYIGLDVNYTHAFLDRYTFAPQDKLNTILKFGIVPAGININLDFTAMFKRLDYKGDIMDNTYVLNAGIDWNYKERFGIGFLFNNIIYYTKYEIVRYYDEPGFEFVGYFKVGF